MERQSRPRQQFGGIAGIDLRHGGRQLVIHKAQAGGHELAHLYGMRQRVVDGQGHFHGAARHVVGRALHLNVDFVLVFRQRVDPELAGLQRDGAGIAVLRPMRAGEHR